MLDRSLLLVALSSLIAVACATEAPAPEKRTETKPAAPAPVVVDKAKLAALARLPVRFETEGRELTPERIALGKMLYFEPRLSKGGDVSCNSCHDLATFGVDGKPTSTGHKGQLGGRNSPTVYNAAGHFAQFWDGRAKDVEEQAKGPVLNPVEMAMPNAKAVEKVLSGIPEYVAAFKKAFPAEKKPVTFDNMAVAIAAFERGLATPSRFDVFLAGDDKALSDAEKQGLNAFMDTGCAACHSGALFGGAMYQKLGLVKPWPTEKDTGRFEVTKKDADKFFFKVPSLRNIEKTAPYFHDGSVASLDEAVKLMATHQLGKELTAEQVGSIVTFLKALTGTPPADALAAPELPKGKGATKAKGKAKAKTAG